MVGFPPHVYGQVTFETFDHVCSYCAEKFTEVLQKQQAERAEREKDRIRLITADPFDYEAQQKIAEEIRYLPSC